MIFTILHTHSLYVPFMSLKLLPSVVSASQMMRLPRVVWDQLTNPAADNTYGVFGDWAASLLRIHGNRKPITHDMVYRVYR